MQDEKLDGAVWSEHAGWVNKLGIDFNLTCDSRCGIEDVLVLVGN